VPIYKSFFQAQQQLADIEAIDYFFAKEMLTVLSKSTELSAEQEKILIHVFFALSVSLRAGHTCLPLTELAQQHWAVAFDELGKCSCQGFVFPDNECLFNVLTALDLSANTQQPIVFENNRVYMRRYYQFEQTLVQAFKARMSQRLPTSLENISSVLQQLFPPPENELAQEFDWQKIAVANAMNKNFTVIAGGPGTGKTYTVTKLLAALVMLNNKSDANKQALEIALVAPTGKAAQRLSESIINAITGFKTLINDNVLAAIPSEAKTIHRLLGVIPNSPNFRHNQNNLLSCDVLLIDEVSMVDLPMMTRIFRALKSTAKVILLGDADQLPSVAVGSVLADIAPRPHSGYSPSNANYLAQACQLDVQLLNHTLNLNVLNPNAVSYNEVNQTASYSDHLSFLVTSRRFDGEGEIGRLAAYVIKGDNTQSWQLLNDANKSNKAQLSLVEGDLHTWLSPLIKEYYQGISKCSTLDEAFALLAKFRILCVTRQGEFGVDTMNQWVKEQLVVNTAQPWGKSQQNYHGMPIMISENDYRLGLFNGDVGLLWQVNRNASSHSNSGNLMAFFEQPKAEGGEIQYKTLLPSRLPKYDSVYAMTIHKTQGSEFAHVAMVLPKLLLKQSNNLLLSRELLYTGITRAKTQLTIASNKQTWQQGVTNVVKRYSGLNIAE